ncbi:tetratricopeptide repeat protein [Gordonia paraffinivorans]|uniref:tetratricopeptide repeat protein n=1 Tax=Gordonia paraffinivorans TaxID=175628 RepID=UPI000D60F987|nr:tetratricopeptide repeat protein [Gordonia paraffinivorans]PWD42020.1 co-chaperone YbbN [Gordonia paraffinivorans]
MAMSGAVDLGVIKERAEAQRAAAQRAEAQRAQTQNQNPAAGAGAPAGPPAGAPPAGPAVIDVTEVTFEAEVLDRSMSQLVVVDLWAEWCGPCKQLSPVLERLAAQSGGRWVLAKVDVDANPRIAQAFRVQSIPMVVAIVQGQPVTAFNGVRSEAEITAWIDEIFAQVGHVLTGAPADAPAEEPTDPRMAAAEEKMNEGDFDGALAVYRSIVEAEPDNVEAASAARNLEFILRARAHDPSIVENAAPHDVDAQLAAADVLLLSQKPEEAFDRIIGVVRVTAGDERERARTRLLELFELFDPAEPFVVSARRKLAMALY